ncbi:MAG: hypothetical protein LBT00_10295 [Spirochaetaceae bacterium]|nr:hypothetical protein [Spirochaetaceae bacterium]
MGVHLRLKVIDRRLRFTDCFTLRVRNDDARRHCGRAARHCERAAIGAGETIQCEGLSLLDCFALLTSQ